jgi:UDP:flavonoid glycosyltransferase YjiC (YdhE family)
MLETGYALLSDIPEFVRIGKVPDRYHFVGPFITRLEGEIPDEILNMPKDLPIVYFAMGSSGKQEIVKKILEGFAGKPYRVIAPVKHLLEGKRSGGDYFNTESVEDGPVEKTDVRGADTTNRISKRNPELARQMAEEMMSQKGMSVDIPENVLVTGWLPAHKVNPLASVSIIHGGQGTVYNALASGTPVVGVGMQPEQEANLECLVRHGIGIRIRKKRVTAEKVLDAVSTLLADETAKEKAKQLQKLVQAADGPTGAAAFIVDTFQPGNVS